MQTYNPIVPPPIKKKLTALEEMCTDHPTTIPVAEVARFLGVKAECLRFHIEQGRASFALGGDVGTMSRHFVIPTATFYFWYIQGAIAVQDAPHRMPRHRANELQ